MVRQVQYCRYSGLRRRARRKARQAAPARESGRAASGVAVALRPRPRGDRGRQTARQGTGRDLGGEPTLPEALWPLTGSDVKALVGPRMKEARGGKPVSDQLRHASPCEPGRARAPGREAARKIKGR